MKSSTLYDPGTTLLGVNTKEMTSVSWTDIYILMFIVALFTVTKCQWINWSRRYCVHRYKCHIYDIYISCHIYIWCMLLFSHVQFCVTPWTAAYQAPLSFTINLSQHQGLFQSVRSLHQVARLLEHQFQLQHPFF